MENIIEKIKKLQALAERPGTPEEAANAMARIQEILMRHNLSMEAVNAFQVKDVSDLTNERHNLNEYQTRHDGDFALKLIRAIASFNFCEVIGHRGMCRQQYGFNEGRPKDQGDFTIVGRRHNVEVVIYMFHYCLNNIKILANEGWKTYDRTTTKIKTVYVRHFFQGAVDALWSRLYDEQKEARKEHGEEAVNGLILRSSQAVQNEVARLFNNLTRAKVRQYAPSDMRAEGYRAGQKMNLSKGLDGDNYQQQKRLG